MASKSLGTLTLDLVAKTGGFIQGMSKAERSSKKWRKQVESDLHKVGNAIKIGSAAAVAGLGAMIVQTTNSAREIRNLAQLAGSTPQDFQKMSYAAARFGIEQGKISDILKDVNDRIGDFVQTGGGPMADFFENIAPKVGVTADQFERLSGPDALQLYVDSLEKAGVSQKDMTFYMEAIASDATALIPLLRDNGREFQKLAAEAERTGNVFSELEFEQLEQIKTSFDELTGAATGMKNEIVLAALPAVEDLVDLLSSESTLNSAKALGTALVTSMNFVIEAIDGAIKVTQFLAEELAAFIHGPAFDDIPRLTEKLDDMNGALAEQEKRLKSLRETPNLVPKEVIATEEERLRRIKAETQALEDLIKSAREAEAAKLGAGSGVDKVEVPDTGGSSNRPRFREEGPKSNKVRGDSILEGIDAKERGQEIIAAQMAETDAVKRGLDRQYAIEQEHADRMLALEDGLRSGAIESREEFNALAVESERQKNEQMLEISDSYWERYLAAAQENLQSFDVLAGNVLENFSSRFGDAFESVIFDAENLGDAIDGLAEGMARSVVNAIGEMAAQWLAFQAVQLAVGKTTTAAAIGEAAAAGSAIAAAYGPAAIAASLATGGANSIGAIAGITATTSAMQASNLIGMAHEGADSIPKSGTWLLEKGERVTTAETSAKLDKTLDNVQKSGSGGGNPIEVTNVFNIASGASAARAELAKLMPMIEERTKAGVLRGINNGGPLARATGRRT